MGSGRGARTHAYEAKYFGSRSVGSVEGECGVVMAVPAGARVVGCGIPLLGFVRKMAVGVSCEDVPK